MKINHSQADAAGAASAPQLRTADLLSLGKSVDSLSQPSDSNSRDAVSLSGVASGIESTIRAQAVERQNRIEELQRKISDGSYTIDDKELSRSIVRDLTSERGQF